MDVPFDELAAEAAGLGHPRRSGLRHATRSTNGRAPGTASKAISAGWNRKAYKMHVRVLLSRYRAYTTCPDCQGARFQPEALLYHWLSHAAAQPEEDRTSLARHWTDPGGFLRAARFAMRCALIGRLAERQSAPDRMTPLAPGAGAKSARGWRYLVEVGLGYLTLDRPTRTLSGGETERVNLTTCLGTRLVNTLFVLDEPSVGLHPRDTERLVRILRAPARRREHGGGGGARSRASCARPTRSWIWARPRATRRAGGVSRDLRGILRSQDSLTGQYLSGRKRMELPRRAWLASSSPFRAESRREGWSCKKSGSLWPSHHDLRP